MAIIVEHDKRKKEILEKSLDLFVEEGYEDVTYQKIADRCGITRTSLYLYFKNKREIFLWSIKQFTGQLEVELMELIRNNSEDSVKCLELMFEKIFEYAQNNPQLFKVILGYLIQQQKSGVDVNERVQRRVIRVTHLMSTIIIRGQKAGQFKQCSVKEVNDLFYCLLESGIFRMAVLGYTDLDQIRTTIGFAINQLKS